MCSMRSDLLNKLVRSGSNLKEGILDARYRARVPIVGERAGHSRHVTSSNQSQSALKCARPGHRGS